MEDKDTSNLHFYPSKVKNFLLTIMGLAFIAIGFGQAALLWLCR